MQIVLQMSRILEDQVYGFFRRHGINDVGIGSLKDRLHGFLIFLVGRNGLQISDLIEKCFLFASRYNRKIQSLGRQIQRDIVSQPSAAAEQ